MATLELIAHEENRQMITHGQFELPLQKRQLKCICNAARYRLDITRGGKPRGRRARSGFPHRARLVGRRFRAMAFRVHPPVHRPFTDAIPAD